MQRTITTPPEDRVLILGDFSSHVVANRLGFTVEPG